MTAAHRWVTPKSHTIETCGRFTLVLSVIAWARTQPPWTERDLADAFALHWQSARKLIDGMLARGLVRVEVDAIRRADRRFGWRA